MDTNIELQLKIAKTVLKAYTTGNFEELFPLMTDDYEHSSFWVLETLKGKEPAIEYYRKKCRAIKDSLPNGRLVKIQDKPKMVDSVIINGEVKRNILLRFLETDKIAILLEQQTKKELEECQSVLNHFMQLKQVSVIY